MLLVKMALKNLTRHKRRVIAIGLILALGIFSYLTIDALMIGLTNISIDNMIELQTGDLQIVEEEYWEEREEIPLDNLIRIEESLLEDLRGENSITNILAQLKFSAKLNNGYDELPVIGYGIDPIKAKEIFATDDYIIEGKYLPASGGYTAVLAKELADLMDFKVGDYLTLLFKTKEDSFNTIDAEIVGLMNTPDAEVNGNFVYLPLSLVQSSLNAEKQASQLVVKLSDLDQAQAITKELNDSRLENNLEAHSWHGLAGTIIAMSKAQGVETAIMMGVILMIAAIGIINTVILSSLERTQEIGMMKALGFKSKEIIQIFIIESMGIGLIGGVIGLLLSGIGVSYLSTYGIDIIGSMGGGSFGMPLGTIYGVFKPSHFMFIFIFGVILSGLASIPPAYWAAKKNAVDAIHNR